MPDKETLMNSPRVVQIVAGALATVLFASSFATAQMSPEKVAATNKILQQVKTTVSKLPASHQMMLDGYANVRHLADAWQAFGMRLAADASMPVIPACACGERRTWPHSAPGQAMSAT